MPAAATAMVRPHHGAGVHAMCDEGAKQDAAAVCLPNGMLRGEAVHAMGHSSHSLMPATAAACGGSGIEALNQASLFRRHSEQLNEADEALPLAKEAVVALDGSINVASVGNGEADDALEDLSDLEHSSTSQEEQELFVEQAWADKDP